MSLFKEGLFDRVVGVGWKNEQVEPLYLVSEELDSVNYLGTTLEDEVPHIGFTTDEQGYNHDITIWTTSYFRTAWAVRAKRTYSDGSVALSESFNVNRDWIRKIPHVFYEDNIFGYTSIKHFINQYSPGDVIEQGIFQGDQQTIRQLSETGEIISDTGVVNETVDIIAPYRNNLYWAVFL